VTVAAKPQGVEADPGSLSRIKPRDMVIRFIFGAAVALLAGLVALRFGPRVGGLFLAFPAILPASLTLIEQKESRLKAEADATGGILGSAGMISFAAVTLLGVGFLQSAVALFIALAAWAAVAVCSYLALRRLWPAFWTEDSNQP
jgi:hypothetical protein